MTVEATKKQNIPTVPPLIPLEYCTPERAARLLGCEVEDLFHWAEIGVVTLYAEFNGPIYSPSRTIPSARRVHCFGEIEGVKSFFGKVLERKPSEKTVISSDCFSSKNANLFFLETSFESDAVYMKHGFSNDAENIGEQTYGTIDYKYILLTPNPQNGADISCINGFWKVHGISEYRLRGYDDIDVTWSIEHSAPSNYSMYIQDLNIDDMIYRFRFKRHDLLKLHEHIRTGQPMGNTRSKDGCLSIESSLSRKIVSANSRERVTSKQCRFIVDLLKSHGLTDDDFKGSIGALRLKIANKAPNIGDPSVDDNTLIDWLKKGGVR